MAISRHRIPAKAAAKRTPQRPRVQMATPWAVWQGMTAACALTTKWLQVLMQDYWKLPLTLQLFSVSDQNGYCWQADEYFVSQTPLNIENSEEPWSTDLRISEPLIGLILGETLGYRAQKPDQSQDDKPFQLSSLTAFETFLLQDFAKSMYQIIFQTMAHHELDDVPESPVIHLVWLVGHPKWSSSHSKEERKNSDGTYPKRHGSFFGTEEPNYPQPEAGDETSAPVMGKIVLTLPLECCKLVSLKAFTDKLSQEVPVATSLVPVESTDDAFDEEDSDETHIPPPTLSPNALGEFSLRDIQVPIDIHVGETRITLEDLKQLERDDVVLLENSNSQQMSVLIPHSNDKLSFFVDIQEHENLEILGQQELETMEQQYANIDALKEDLWDNLLIDVNAEFSATRIPLRQLKDMSEGLVVEISDLIKNQIRLHVKGKTLAQGELVIIGDKFGVLVTSLEKDPDAPQDEESGAAHKTPTESAVEETAKQSQDHASDSENPQDEGMDDLDEGLSMDEADMLPKEDEGESSGDDVMNEVDDFLNTDFDEENF